MKTKIVISTLLLLVSYGLQAQTLISAACDGNMNQLDSLLQRMSVDSVSNNGSTALHAAAYCRQDEVFDYLIEKGANVNARNKYNDTPLLYAAQREQVRMMKVMIEKGAEVNTLNEQGQSPLFIAVRSGNMEMFDLLIDGGADINFGEGLLHRAVIKDRLELVQKLINEQTNVDATNDRGNTPLTIAIRQGSEKIMEYLVFKGADLKKVPKFNLSGAYIGQETPGLEAVMFAPNFISTEDFNHSPAFSPDETEFYYTDESSRGATIMVSRLESGLWTTPVPADIEGDYREIDPFITTDGKRMFFNSNRPITPGDTSNNMDMWYVDKEADGWGEPQHLGGKLSTEHAEWFPTAARNGNLYFTYGPGRTADIAYSPLRNGKYEEVISLGDSVNSPRNDYDPTIAPDESFVIFSSNREGGKGSVDIYVSFRKADGSWGKAKNLGDRVNTSTIEFAPRLSNDGKYLFFNREGDIWWINAEVIDELRE